MNIEKLHLIKRHAEWLGSPKRVLKQILSSIWSYVSLPFVKYSKNAVFDFFYSFYRGKPDPLVFDGKDRRYFDRIEDLFDVNTLKDQSVLDLGCGDGSFYFWLKHKQIQVKKYIGIDFAHEETTLDEYAYICNKDITTIETKEYIVSLIISVNIFCYLDNSSIDLLLRSKTGISKLIIIDPFPGIFWDAQFDGIKLFYRSPRKLIKILNSYGWVVQGISIDYGIKIKDFFLFPLSYCVSAI